MLKCFAFEASWIGWLVIGLGRRWGEGDFAFGGFFITPYVHMPICALGSTNAKLGGGGLQTPLVTGEKMHR